MKKLLILLVLFSVNALAKPVNINTADAKQISQSLKGIGLVKAEAIIEYRTKYGPFKTRKELSKVKGIGEKTIEKNLNDIILSKSTSKNKS